MGVISNYPRRTLIVGIAGSMMFLLNLAVFTLPSEAYAQFGETSIARTQLITGGVAESGDLVSFDRSTQTFRLAQVISDSNLFGVVVTNPTILLRTSTESVPLVSSGEVYVQVTTANGPISAGDYITSSSIPGKGQKAGPSTSVVLGIALDSFPALSNATPSVVSTTTVDGGSIRVLLAIGPKLLDSGGDGELIAANAAGENEQTSSLDMFGVSTSLATLIKYLLATIVVVGSVYVAFRNFGSNMRDSIISVGRNPLAKASIQSMVMLNTVLIVLVSVAGLFIGLMILFVQL